MLDENVATLSVVNKAYPGYDPDNMGLFNAERLGLVGQRICDERVSLEAPT
jgi:hypothetical protein